jgi:hypothetical protein
MWNPKSVVAFFAVVLQREVHDRRRPAERGRARPGLKVVRAEAAAERQVHVGVDVDAARHDVPIGGVDLDVGLDGHPHADRGHPLVVDHDVGLRRLGRGHDGPALDEGPHDVRAPSS